MDSLPSDKTISDATKINVLRYFLEWVILDFMYRTLKGKSTKPKSYDELLESFEHKKVPGIFEEWSKEKIIDQDLHKKLLYVWKNIFIKTYHHKFDILDVKSLKKEYNDSYSLIQELLSNLKNYWLNTKLSFTSNINSKYKTRSHITYGKNIICNTKKINILRKYDKPVVNITTKTLINNWLLKEKSKRLVLIKETHTFEVCHQCLKRIFGINQKNGHSDFNSDNLINYLKSQIDKPYK